MQAHEFFLPELRGAADTSGTSITSATIVGARAGFDKLVLSLCRNDADTVVDWRPNRLPTLSGYRLDPAARPARGEFQTLHRYFSASTIRPDLDLLTEPRQSGLPLGQLAMRASVEHLITSLSIVLQLLDPFLQQFNVRPLVSLAELAIDFPIGSTTHAQLTREIYGARTRSARWCETTRYLTTQSGAVRVRLYPKHEDGLSLLRVEQVLPRRFWRRHGVNVPGDLRTTSNWFDAALRALRFVEYRDTRRRPAAENERVQQLIGEHGVNEALRRYDEGDPQRIRRRLMPTDIDRRARAALEEFRRGLSCQPPSASSNGRTGA